MSDSWLDAHANDPQRQDILTDESAVVQHLGITCDSPLNSWAKKGKHGVGQRLDYIFYRRTPQLVCDQSEVTFTDRIPGTHISYSDHFGVHSTFTIHSGGKDTEALALDPTKTNLASSMVHDILELLQRDQIATQRTAHWLLVFFVAAVLLVLSLCVLLSVSHNGALSFVVGLVLILLAAAGTIALIVGFVFGQTEQRALRQFISEVETLLEHLHGR